MRDFVTRFADGLEARALDREREGNAVAAGMCRRIARDLLEEYQTYMSTMLSYAEGAAESGYDAESLRKLVAQGRWSKRREDLPRRPRPIRANAILTGARGGPTLAQAVVHRRLGAVGGGRS